MPFWTKILRYWSRNRLITGLNLLGLSVGMAACLAIGQFVRYEWSYDRQSPYAEDIWRVYCQTVSEDGSGTLDANTHSAIGPALDEDLAGVIDYTRLYNRNEDEVVFWQEEQPIKLSGVWTVDPGFLSMFAANFIAGDPSTCLTEPYALVLTASGAEQLFGHQEVIGETIEVPSGVFQGQYTVKGLVEDPSPNTHIKYRALVSYATRYAKGHEDNWDSYWEYNYFQTLPGTDIAQVQQQLDRYSEDQLKEHGLQLHLQALTDIHLYSDLTYEIEANANARTVRFMGLAGLLILVIAFFNYVNLMTAKAMSRSKEVGVRKVIGASRGQLIGQFIIEGLSLNVAALGIALLALEPIVIGLGNLTDRPLFAWFNWDWQLALMILALLLTSVFLSCLYPALVLSRYQPSQVLKGQLSRSKEGQSVRRGLVVFQFACSTILLVAVIVVAQQLAYLKQQDLGLSLDQMVALKVPELDFRGDTTSFIRLQSFREEVQQLSEVKAFAVSSAAPSLGISGISGGSSGMHRTAEPEAGVITTIYYLDISPNFFDTYDIEFLAGGTYPVSSREELSGNVILNEAARKALGFSDASSAMDEGIAFDRRPERPIRVRGVIADFHIESLKEEPRPTLYHINPRMVNGYFSLKMSGKDVPELVQALEAKWTRFFPQQPFEYWLVDEQFALQYQAEQNLSRAFGAFALLAVFIAGLGLFGLATFTTEQRAKEIGIRKVLGAGVAHIVALLSKDFLIPVILGLGIGAPIAWYIMNQWLADFAYHTSIRWWVFGAAALFALLVAHLTVGFQSLKTALANPADSIRDE